VIDLLKSGGDRMMSHVLISLLQCVSRQGDIAWVDANFRARLWAAVDKGICCLNKIICFWKLYHSFSNSFTHTHTHTLQVSFPWLKCTALRGSGN
jgi:hypothetical protein